MKTLFKHIFIDGWPRKLVAVLAAVVIWLLVSHNITVTRTVSNIPVRVLNIPEGKTAEGMLANGLLAERVTLAVTGRRGVVSSLSSSDVEVVTDAATMGDRWTITVTKKNLRSTNPDINIRRGVTSVAPVELTVELEPLVTEKIPITITQPIGEAPKGYSFIDVWPQRLMQTVSGPESQVQELKAKGLRLTFNLNRVTKQELDQLSEKAQQRDEDEIRYFVPEAWKRVVVPFEHDKIVEINDPEGNFLHLDFLRQELLPIGTPIPVNIFFPIIFSETLNPKTYTLEEGKLVASKNGIDVLTLPLYVRNVSRLFLDIVKSNVGVTFVALPTNLRESFPWSVQFINPVGLENIYVRTVRANAPAGGEASPQFREGYLRSRFRKYMREFELVKEDGGLLHLVGEIDDQKIIIHQDSD